MRGHWLVGELAHLRLSLCSVVEFYLLFRLASGSRLRWLLWGRGCVAISRNDATLVGVPNSIGRHDRRALRELLRRHRRVAQAVVATWSRGSLVGPKIVALLVIGRAVLVLFLLLLGRGAGKELLRSLGRLLGQLLGLLLSKLLGLLGLLLGRLLGMLLG